MILPRLQFITSDSCDASLVDQARYALSIGVRWIQVRSKFLGETDLLDSVRTILQLAKTYSAIVTVNDRIDVAVKCNADGVHLGRTDASPAEAALILPPPALVGGSINSSDDIEYYSTSKLSYCGVGPLRSSSTKANLRRLLGIEGVIDLAHQVATRLIAPTYAVGGVLPDDVLPLFSRGVYGIAVSATIHSADHATAQRLVNLTASFERNQPKATFCKEMPTP